MALGSWPVRGPSFKAIFFLLSIFFFAIPDWDLDSCSGELACEKPKF